MGVAFPGFAFGTTQFLAEVVAFPFNLMILAFPLHPLKVGRHFRVFPKPLDEFTLFRFGLIPFAGPDEFVNAPLPFVDVAGETPHFLRHFGPGSAVSAVAIMCLAALTFVFPVG